MAFLDLKPYMVDIIYDNISGIKKQGNQLVFRCPLCGDGKKRRSKRGHYYLSSSSYYCFNGGCEAYERGMSGYMFLSKLTGLPIREVKKELIKRAGSFRNAMVSSKTESNCEDDGLDMKVIQGSEVTKQLPPEGLIREQILDGDFTEDLPKFVSEIITNRKLDKAPFFPPWFKFYFDKREERLVIPWNENYYQERAITHEQAASGAKYKFPPDIQKPIFGMEMLDFSFPYVFLVEGVFDSVWVKNGVAVGSLTLSNHQLDILRSLPDDIELIYLMDNQWSDKTSMEHTRKLLDEQPFLNIFIWPKELERFKDINDSVIYSDKLIQLWTNKSFLKSRIFHGLKGKLELSK